MRLPRKAKSAAKTRTRRIGRGTSVPPAYRYLRVEQLEDRRVLSGTSPLAMLGPLKIGPPLPPAIALVGGTWSEGSSLTVGSGASNSYWITGGGGTVVQQGTLIALPNTAETTVGQSVNAFAESLYSQIQSQAGGSGNLFLSPLSISTALAMAYAGAQGQTATQMAAALHVTVDPSTLASGFGSLIADLNSAGQNGAGGSNYSLTVADALWAQQGFTYLAPFLNLMQADYGGGLHQVDFANKTETARQAINDWVEHETNNKIQDLFPAGALSPATRLVLTNALYFKGQWATAFNANLTQNAAFRLASGSQVQVPTMHATSSYGYMQSNGYQVLELPYQGNRLVMDVILPSATSGLSGLSAGKLPANLSGWLQGLTSQQVAVSLPKFTMTAQFNLNQPLEALGMTNAFTNAANFSGISNSPLKIDAVVHKAFIDVDENGTEAAAATGGIAVPTAIVAPTTPAIVFNADHPFLFAIRDTQSGSVLFMGQVANPSTMSGDSSAPAVPAAANFQVKTPYGPHVPGTVAGGVKW